MDNNHSINKKVEFEEPPSTQEFLDSFLPALEEQYSYERLKELPVSQLEKEIEHVNYDLSILNWRLDHDGQYWRSEAYLVEETADLANSHSLEKPTLDQLYQINWTVIRIERNVNKAIRVAKSKESRGLISKIKHIHIGSNKYGGVEIDLSGHMINDPEKTQYKKQDRE